MAQFKSIPINKIFIPERLRVLEEDHALALAQSIVEHGLLNPITVRTTPAGEQPYTLVAGRHRLRAVEINDDDGGMIDATIVEADKAEAQLIEISENLFRNDLSMLDRAIFVETYRDVWEGKHGKVEAGRPQNRANLALLFQDEAEGGFSQHVADRMGLSKRAVKRLNQIAKHLHPNVRKVISGTPAADNQSALLSIAKMEPKKQRQLAVALGKEPDLKKARELVEGAKPKPSERDRQKVIEIDLATNWKKADTLTRKWFLNDIGLPKEMAEAVFGAIKAFEDRK